MKFGGIELLLVILLLSGAGFIALQFAPKDWQSKVFTSVPLSPEVTAYIDQKLSAGGGADASPAQLRAKIAELESKLADFEKFRKFRDTVVAKRGSLRDAAKSLRRTPQEWVDTFRSGEILRLRELTAKACAGLPLGTKKPVGNAQKK